MIYSERSCIHIEIQPLGGGSIEHYYHFVFDLLLPLSRGMSGAKREVVFSVKRFGPLSLELQTIFPGRVILTDKEEHVSALPLLGMNPHGLKRMKFNLDSFSSQMMERLHIEGTNVTKKIILIERSIPHDYYLQDAKKKGTGTERRSIRNHDELIKLLLNVISANYVFENVILEGMSFKDQIRLFSSATLVIGQHGGGLTNVVWMSPASHVIELGFRSRPHFAKVCKAKKHSYYIYKNYKAKHINVKINHFKKWLYSIEPLQEYLRH
ncbi:MAG: glycosyltransferase family 61 protein [Cyclobacteriaceae bacterium]